MSITPSLTLIKTLLHKAIRWKELLESGKVSDEAEIARYEGYSRARATQIMNLLLLAPEIQNHILSLSLAASRHPVTERSLRPVTQIENQMEQIAAFEALGVALEKSCLVQK
jgi:hypothetical protein